MYITFPQVANSFDIIQAYGEFIIIFVVFILLYISCHRTGKVRNSVQETILKRTLVEYKPELKVLYTYPEVTNVSAELVH